MNESEIQAGQQVLLRELSNGPPRLLPVRVVRVDRPHTTGTVPVLVRHRSGWREWVPAQLLEPPAETAGDTE